MFIRLLCCRYSCSKEVRVHACIPDIDDQYSVRCLAIFRLDSVYEFVISVNKDTTVCEACYVLRSGSRCPRRGCTDSSLLYILKMLSSFSADLCPNVLLPYARASYTLLYGSAVLILRYAPLDALLYCFPS